MIKLKIIRELNHGFKIRFGIHVIEKLLIVSKYKQQKKGLLRENIVKRCFNCINFFNERKLLKKADLKRDNQISHACQSDTLVITCIQKYFTVDGCQALNILCETVLQFPFQECAS